MNRASRGFVFFLIGAIAAAMGWFAWNGECRDGTVFATESGCREAAGFDAAFCREAFKQAHAKATIDYAPFRTQTECLEKFPTCVPHGVITGGFVPTPRGTCVARIAGGISGTPVYQRLGANLSSR